MAKPIRTPAEWAEIHQTAIALGSIRAAAKAHGVPEAAAYQRAHRERWLCGQPKSVAAAREQRIESAKARGVTVSENVKATPGADILDKELREMGQQSRHALAAAIRNAAGQAKKTKHPLAHSRHIKDTAQAAALVHPDQFGERPGAGGGDGKARVQIALVQVFGPGINCPMLGGEMAAPPDEKKARVIALEDTGGNH
jgi:hypothetical protein